MKKKYIITILIIILIILIATISIYVIYTNNIEYKNIKLSESCSIDIPKTNQILNKTIDNMTIYNDTNNKICVLYYNSYDSGLAESIGNGLAYKEYFESYKKGATDITNEESKFVNKSNNDSVWYNKNNKYYMASVGNSTTHDNILIISENKKILEHMLSSIKYFKTNTNEISENSSDNKVSDNSENSNSKPSSHNSDSSKKVVGTVEGDHNDIGYEYADGHVEYYSTDDGSLFSVREPDGSFSYQKYHGMG